jgi:hypothetical protein
MNRVICFYVLLLAFCAAISIGGGARVVDKSLNAEFATSELGDTAQVSKKAPQVAVDSFVYIDTFSYQADTTAHQTITWLSPVQIMRLTPGTVDSSTVIACSVAFQAVTLGFTVDPGDAYITVAKICDTLTSLINATATLTDSVTAEDSGTYVKIVDLFSEKTHSGNWSMIFAMTGGTGTMDTAGTVTTIAMVCDSMVASVNADAGLDSFLTAYDSATFYITQSDDAGVLFWDSSLNDPDTHATVTRSQANVTSNSNRTDTFNLGEFMVSLVDGQFRGSGVYGDIVLSASSDTNQGLGDSDSGYIWLLTGRPVGSNIIYTVIAQDSANALPCTLHVAVDHAASNDTILHNYLALAWAVMDTLTDTTMQTTYPITVDLIVTDGF